MKFLLIITTILFICNNFAKENILIAGGVDGGGADDYSNFYGTAWFLKGEKQQIDICLKVKEGLSVSRADIYTTISTVYNQWDSYIKENNLYDEDTKNSMKIETRIRLVENCKNADIEFYVGITTPEIIDIKKKFNDPTAFTYRIKYDENKGWSKGIVWIKGNYVENGHNYGDVWSIGNNLYMIFLHEIGHTFGNPHKPNTIMNQNILNLLLKYEPIEFKNNDYYKNILKRQKQIDWESTVIPCFECIAIGANGRMWLDGSKHEKLTFNLLLNRDPIGNVRTSYNLNLDEKNMTISGDFIVQDSMRTKFPIKFNFGTSSSLKTDPYAMFKRYRVISSEDGLQFESNSAGGISVATIYGEIIVGNKKFNVVMENEMFGFIIAPPVGEKSKPDNTMLINEAVKSIYIIHNGQKHYIFAKVKKYDFDRVKTLKQINKRIGIGLSETTIF